MNPIYVKYALAAGFIQNRNSANGAFFHPKTNTEIFIGTKIVTFKFHQNDQLLKLLFDHNKNQQA